MHMLGDAEGVPLCFLLSSGQADEIVYAQPFLSEVSISSSCGRSRKRCTWLLADISYDCEMLRRYYGDHRMKSVILIRSMGRKSNSSLPRLFDRAKYSKRNVIKRVVGRLKKNHRVVPRFDKPAKS